MDSEEIAVRITKHDEQIKVANNRIADLEEQGKMMYDLIATVKELSINMKQMVEVQKNVGERVSELEGQPARQWSNTKKTFFTAITSSIGTAVAAVIIYIFITAAQNGVF